MEKCLKPTFSLKLLAMTFESSWRHLAPCKDDDDDELEFNEFNDASTLLGH